MFPGFDGLLYLGLMSIRKTANNDCRNLRMCQGFIQVRVTMFHPKLAGKNMSFLP